MCDTGFRISHPVEAGEYAPLSKLDEGKAVYFKKKMGALMDKIIMPEEGIPFPSRLTLEEQGAFILGYYQETQARYKGKEEE